MPRCFTACLISFFILLPSASSALEYKLEKATITTLAGNVCEVKGLVRNLESRAVAGYVDIQLLDNNNDILTTHKAYLNDGNPLLPNQAGPFKYYMQARECEGATKVSVILKEKRSAR